MAEIRKIGSSERPSTDSDHILIERTPSGRFVASGSVVTGSEDAAFVPGVPFDTFEAAIAAATVRADRNGVPIVHVLEVP